MKAILHGRRYDTESATMIAEWSNGLPCTDFHTRDEQLYLTPNGRWFIVADGGCQSTWSIGIDTWDEGDLLPISAADAKRWLEAHQKLEALEQHFAAEIEDA